MNFTADWFSHNLSLFEKYFLPYSNKEVHYLEIGSYEGRSACWMLDNVIKQPASTATFIDIWWNWKDFSRFVQNLEIYNHRQIFVYKDWSQNILPRLTRWYDIIYIDGGHYTLDVMSDLLQSWRTLKYGGIIILDDYLWKGDETNSTPKEAIDLFIRYTKGLSVLHKEYSVVLQKNAPI